MDGRLTAVKMVDVSGYRLAVTVRGAGPLVVFVSGIGEPGDNWNSVIGQITEPLPKTSSGLVGAGVPSVWSLGAGIWRWPPRSWVIAAAGWFSVLLRLAYLGVTNAFAVLRLLPLSNRDKDVEILALRHQLTVLERQLGKERVRFDTSDRALLAALLHRLPSDVLRSVRLLVRPDTVLRWHRNLLARRHAAVSRSKRPGRPRTVRSVRVLVLRLARENPSWGYRRLHGELLVLGVKVAPSTVWEILKEAGIDPAPERASSTWADFLRSEADALLACDCLETVTLTGARMYVLR